jgi:hypothetical protein
MALFPQVICVSLLQAGLQGVKGKVTEKSWRRGQYFLKPSGIARVGDDDAVLIFIPRGAAAMHGLHVVINVDDAGGADRRIFSRMVRVGDHNGFPFSSNERFFLIRPATRSEDERQKEDEVFHYFLAWMRRAVTTIIFSQKGARARIA